MIYLRILFAILVPTYLGYLMLSLILNEKNDASFPERLALSYIVGAGTLTLYMFLLSWAGLPLTLFNICAALLLPAVVLQFFALRKGSFLLHAAFRNSGHIPRSKRC